MSKDNILSYGTSGMGRNHKKSNRHIVALSGEVASAWVAWWVKNNIKGEIIYYFNDVLWEHPDLYRFLNDLEKALNIKITKDNDGRTPEQVFYDKKMLGSNRTPICSKVLKAERLQKYVNEGDTVYFGIGLHEVHRAARITPIYARLGVNCSFPMIDNPIMRHKPFKLMDVIGVDVPQMYKDGFEHNNCHGACVRAGAKQWLSVLRVYPEVYADRERIEQEFTKWNNKRRGVKGNYHFLKDISLKELREQYQKGYEFDFGDNDEWQGECVGICGRLF